MKSHFPCRSIVLIFLIVSIQFQSAVCLRKISNLKLEIIRSILNDKEYLSLKPQQQLAVFLVAYNKLETFLKAQRQKTRY